MPALQEMPRTIAPKAMRILGFANPSVVRLSASVTTTAMSNSETKISFLGIGFVF